MPKLLVVMALLFLMVTGHKTNLPDSKRASDARAKVWPQLQKELTGKGFNTYGSIYIRVFKDIEQMEIWVKLGSKYKLFKTYDVCYYSGGLGPKTKTGDGKSPEGFYTIEPKQLNPVSNYYLAINVGYPNKVEQLKGYTGDAIMVHGHCASIGCYAMTNPKIEEIYTLVYQSLAAGQQKIHLDIFPFKMDEDHLKFYAAYKQDAFWRTMKPGYELFEKKHIPADYEVKGKEYAFKR
ncbi:Murein L,D-transpeptidase YafK [Mucilaginibacter pineti]|uniref:Murein L,D-transpeptidase YafK n=1 Tax=Mucilaginibacter pineti TaxID=1391627 RepID=A0A1G7J8I8_9SPHI|nr:L,D-transpeptidase family protein [Mucilaginibacter pineti]SDF21292.1 Murein L,D-transpeptidase YafK [Mucilaginibacter pineti]